MKKIFISLFVIILSIGLHSAQAQCNSFTKKKCMPGLSPYIHNGQLNSTSLTPGETAELVMSFHAGQEYRVLTCAQEVLGEVWFRILDSQHNPLFNSKEAKENKFDFNVATSQQLIVEVNVPSQKSNHGIVEEGCVSVLVGFKK